MWPCPSVDLRFAVCMSELMSATSNTPSCWAIDTRAPLFGIVILLSALMESSCHRLLHDLPATREGLYPHFYASTSEIARIKILNSTPNNNHPGKGDFRLTRWGALRSQEPLISTGRTACYLGSEEFKLIELERGSVSLRRNLRAGAHFFA